MSTKEYKLDEIRNEDRRYDEKDNNLRTTGK